MAHMEDEQRALQGVPRKVPSTLPCACCLSLSHKAFSSLAVVVIVTKEIHGMVYIFIAVDVVSGVKINTKINVIYGRLHISFVQNAVAGPLSAVHDASTAPQPYFGQMRLAIFLIV